MAIATNLGFPRIGAHRELKKALEKYWKGESQADDLMTVAKAIREENWKRQRDAGIDHIPSNDFALYDQVLDHIQMFGAIPERFAALRDGNPYRLHFAMARGYQAEGIDAVAMEMTKWFDTNYHYIVPEFEADQDFRLMTKKPIEHYAEAKAMGLQTRPVVLGPISFLLLGKMRGSDASPLSLLPKLLPVYEELLHSLQEVGAEWIQIDEPFLALDLNEETKKAYASAYKRLDDATTSLKFCLTTYFEGLRENTELAFSLPVDAVHLDLVRAPEGLDAALDTIRPEQMLSLGLINGRNIWKAELKAAQEQIQQAANRLGKDRLMIGPSCSLLHTPVDLANESALDDELKSWLAFAQQKLEEISILAKAAKGEEVSAALQANADAIHARRHSSRIHNDAIKASVESIDAKAMERQSPYTERAKVQQAELNLPLLPSTTIGSFPQTKEVRKARADFKKGEISADAYESFLQDATRDCIKKQEKTGIDVLVHGEFERNDMVEYFGEKLDGFAFTQNGWVQSYGSRCVKPPIIFGDISRPEAMTVEWAKFAQEQTSQIMKGMLTGPVTILQWSFVRDDQPRSDTCKQIALAIREEVSDLEEAGIRIIQIDEAALREGLPLRRSDWKEYLDWAVDSFRIASSSVEDRTQIHTHMCYSEFNDIIEAVARMDADVISIETSRSQMELLDAFVQFKYPNQIGPGVYDIHSPRIPNEEEINGLLRKALEVLRPEQVWVNPDCGLKTRGWAEVEPALKAMVSATHKLREELEAQRAA